MNWLAHLFLSEQNIDFQMGNILADPLKGRVWDNASIGMTQAMSIHKKIDAFADAHVITLNSKNRLKEKGLLRAVIIDLTYDYFLSKNWDFYCKISLDNFTREFYNNAHMQTLYLPPKASTFINNLIKRDVLNKYSSIELLQVAFERLDSRLSPRLLKRDQASSYFDAVLKNINELERDFLDFFPLLCTEIKPHLDSKQLSHWKL